MEVEAMIRPVVEAAGLELVEAAMTLEHGRRVLRVTVDREGGVDLDAIGGVSERISSCLDREGFQPGPYSLEVSSPGIERPLRDPRDYARRVGERVKVKLAQTVDGTRSLSGTIVAADQAELRIGTKEGERAVAFDDIASARTVFEWGGKR